MYGCDRIKLVQKETRVGQKYTFYGKTDNADKRMLCNESGSKHCRIIF